MMAVHHDSSIEGGRSPPQFRFEPSSDIIFINLY
jgi:hypothetical protein